MHRESLVRWISSILTQTLTKPEIFNRFFHDFVVRRVLLAESSKLTVLRVEEEFLEFVDVCLTLILIDIIVFSFWAVGRAWVSG